MNHLKNIINEIIQEELFKIIVENEMDLAKQAQTAPAPEMDTEENIAMGGGGLEDLASDAGATETAADGSTVDGAADGTEDGLGDDSELDDSMDGGGFGSGSAFGGGGGGGSSGGFDFDSDSDSDAETEDDTDDNNDGTPDSLDDPNMDPVQAIVGIAQDLRTKTGDAQQILNSVKAAIQEKFTNHEDAAAIIQYLWETNDQVLQVVARKLILFIKGQ